MDRRSLTVRDVGRMFGFDLPSPGSGRRSRSKCPMRQHQRHDPTFGVFLARDTGKEMFKCWSCDAPNNKGDAVQLYALLAGVDRLAAWRRLGEEGFAVGGADDSRRHRDEREQRAYAESQKDTAHAIPIEGTRPQKILEFDYKKWEHWRRINTGELDRFAELRGMTGEFLRSHGVIEMGGPYIGFVYFDPKTKEPVRIKVRGTKEKRFWIEPRPPKGDTSGARTLDVMYMGDELSQVGTFVKACVIVEGELDSLSLASCNVFNVVSLPDGSASALTADLRPLSPYNTWLVAMDDDPPGDEAYQVLVRRGWKRTVLRVKWKKIIDGEVVSFKDANDALVRGNFNRPDFLHCLQLPAEDRHRPLRLSAG